MKKIIKATMLFMLLIGSAVLPAFAASTNDNISYSFTIGASQKNGYSGPRDRTTTNTRNSWKVNMTYDSEGAGTKATYWLARASDKAMASGSHTITVGSGNHYYPATNTASNKSVVLAGENNNYTPNRYTVAGYWDEETGVIV